MPIKAGVKYPPNSDLIENIAVLEKFTEVDGVLLYDGEQIKDSTIIDASPKAVFATFAALQADPTANTEDGKTRIYLVTADGKWYYWNTSTWTAGGVYQATGIVDNSVTSVKRTVFGEKGELYGLNPVNFDFINKQIKFPVSSTSIYHRNNRYTINANTVINMDGTYTSALYYNTGTNELVCSSAVPTNEAYLYICTMRVDQKLVFGVDNYNIDGQPSTNICRRWGIIFGKIPLNFNFQTGKLMFNTAESSYRIIYENVDKLFLSANVPYELDLTTTNTYDTACIVYDLLTTTLTVKNSPNSMVKTDILIAIYRRDAKKVWMIGEYLINGTPLNINEINTETLDMTSLSGVDDYVSRIISSETQGFRFLFFTDCHNTLLRENFYKIRIAKHYIKYGLVDAVLVGGDISSETASRSTNLKLHSQVMNELNDGGKTILVAKGNHDIALSGNAPYSVDNVVSDNMWHNIALRQLDGIARFDSVNLQSTYYYLDYEQYKIRIICIDTTSANTVVGGVVVNNPRDVMFVNQNQINWLTSEALNFLDKSDKTEWGVIVFAHASTSPQSGFNIRNGVVVEHLLNAFKAGAALTQSYTYVPDSQFDLSINADFTAQGAMDCICFVHGHGHWDGVFLDAINSIPHIAVIGTSVSSVEPPSGGSNPERIAGTLSAHGFDTFTVDRTNRKIYTHRFGAGDDRIIDY